MVERERRAWQGDMPVEEVSSYFTLSLTFLRSHFSLLEEIAMYTRVFLKRHFEKEYVWLQRKGGSQKLDPPPLFKGGGGSGSPESQPSPKSLNFLLILYFSRSFLEHVS